MTPDNTEQGAAIPDGPRSWEMDAAVKIRDFVLREQIVAPDCHFQFADIIEEAHRPIHHAENINAMGKSQTICDLMEEIQRLNGVVTTLQRERDEAREYAEHLYTEFGDRKVHCVYCGHAFEGGTPPSQDARLTEHIKVCLKHPMRRYEAKLQDAAHIIIELVHASATPEEWKTACGKAGEFIRTFPGRIR